MIYFDNAATSGEKPESVKRAVLYALENLNANAGRGGYKRAAAASEAVYNVRKKVSDFFGSSGPQTVVFCHNCTEALNFVIKGVLERHDHAVISDLEHNAVLRPLNSTLDDYSAAEVSFFDDEVTLTNFKNAVKPETKMVICTAASNVTGKILPIKKIGDMCKERGILFTVDAAQGAGVIPIDMEKMNIDYLCVAGHKGLYAPMSSGILIARNKIARTLIEGGNGINSLEITQSPDLPEGLESGTLNLPDILGIGAGIDFLNKTGIEKIYEKEIRLLGEFYKRISKNEKAVIYTPFPEKDRFAPVLPFNIKDRHSEFTAEYSDLKNVAVRGGFHCSLLAHKKLGTQNTGAVRVSVSCFNNLNEIIYYADVLKKI